MTELLRGAPGPVASAQRHVEADFVAAAYAAYHDELRRFLLHATHDPAAADDLLQDAFVRLVRETHEGRAPLQVRAWLYRVASNLVVSRARRSTSARRWFERYGASSDDAVVESPEVGALRNEAAEDVDAALSSLGPAARAALSLSAQGYHGPEIALALGRTDGATRTLLCRARLRVRHRLVAGARA